MRSNSRRKHIHTSLFIFATLIVFLSLPIFYPVDSFSYIENAEFFTGIDNNYSMVRGPVLPLMLAVAFKLFGYSSSGIQLMLTITFLVFMCACLYIYSSVDYDKSSIGIYLVLFLFAFNPLIQTFAHIIFTEYTAMLLLALYIGIWIYIEKNIYSVRRMNMLLLLNTFLFSMLLYGTKQLHAFIIPIFAVSVHTVKFLKEHKAKYIVGIAASCIAFVLALIVFSSVWGSVIDSLLDQKSDESGEGVDMYQTQNANGYSGAESIKGFAFSAVTDGLRFFTHEFKEDCITVSVYDDSFENIINQYDIKKQTGIVGAVRYFFEAVKHNPERVAKGYYKSYMVLSGALTNRPIDDNYKHCPTTSTVRLDYWQGETIYFSQFFKFERADWNEKLPLIDINLENATDSHRHFGKQNVSDGLISNLVFNTFFYDFVQILHTTVCVFALPTMLISGLLLIMSKKSKNKLSLIFIISFNVFFNILTIVVLGQPIDRYSFPVMLFSMCMSVFVIDYVFFVLKKIVMTHWKRITESQQKA